MVKKVALVGLDGLVPSLMRRYFGDNRLPNMKKLIDEGTMAECVPIFPTNSSSNWNTISTGSLPKTHGVTDMVVHVPGTDLTEVKSGFYSDSCLAEQLWLTCERFDKRVLLLKYNVSWPPNMKKGIQVEGFGAPGGPASRPWGSNPLAISPSSCYSNMPMDNARAVSFSEARLSEWKNFTSAMLPSHQRPLEASLGIGRQDHPIEFNVLLLASSLSQNDSYDTALITRNKDVKKGFTLRKGQLSDWLIEDFKSDEKTIRASFRMKLMDLDYCGHDRVKNEGNTSMGSIFKLFVSQVFPVEGWSFPPSIAGELVTEFGPFLESASHFPFVFGWIDEHTYIDDMAYQAKWIGNATHYLMAKYGWDLYMTHWQGTDNTHHGFLRFDKSVLTEEESKVADNVVLKSHQIADNLVGDIVTAAHDTNKDNKDEIYTFVVSDHGQLMGKRRFFINAYLCQKGLIKLKRDSVTKKVSIDWDKTQAFAQGMVHLYVNLKGREPTGSVNPGKEYEDTIQMLIDILYDIKDPKTGLRPISLALSNKDAEFLGLSGERAGDIVFAASATYAIDNRVKIDGELFEDLKIGFPDGSIHGAQFPTADLGDKGTMKTVFIAHGPTIKKGYVRKKPISVVDIAPTVAHILGISPPRDSEGAIIYDLFE
jgi:predicted AlkP superfamily phosphohydrolase/phosphomutase